MPYVSWTGDWCRLQPAVLTGAQLHVFPLRVARAPLQALCDQRVNTPSGGSVVASPLALPALPDQALLLVAFADFPHITSQDPVEASCGYIDERDVGFFFPVSVAKQGTSLGVFAANPFLWVDNPAGVITGRETFGFPKLESVIDWDAGNLECEVQTLVFPTHSPTTRAEDRTVLELRRQGWFSWLPGLGGIQGVLQELAAGLGVEDLLTGAVEFVLGAIETGLEVTGFDRVRIPLLKQLRDVQNGVATDYQKVVWAEFEITSLNGLWFYGGLLGRRVLEIHDFPSSQVAAALGLSPQTDLGVGLRIDCDLVLRGHHF